MNTERFELTDQEICNNNGCAIKVGVDCSYTDKRACPLLVASKFAIKAAILKNQKGQGSEQARIEERRRIGEWLGEIAKHANFPAELRSGHERLKRGELPEGVKSEEPIVDINDSRLKEFLQ